ncbi:putative pre-mrna-splicing factor cwc26 [Diaporthe ampelina]|uniref:Putative pre-mrna-splicing factor cwc26 n=1 Tax=Diaporthe ampelina TaxID=1214573 RepID=A0A0G2I2C4_9PEZI|nr:putative pre-mrna-splicing factor cwc26 [Diaporthe ampelina]
MPSDLSSYLATHYLTPDTKPSSKKRKRKHDKSSGGGLLIHDDDDQGWGGSSKSRHRGREGDGGGDDALVTVGQVKEVRKTTKANWKTLGGGGSSGPTSKEDKEAAAAADAILASTAAETAAARAAEDDAPTMVDDQTSAARMADGTHAGLQSAAAVTAQIERRQQEERDQFEAERRAGLVRHGEEETYYRDATGRRVDVSMKRAEARRAAQEAEDKERAAKDALKGDVQAEEARRRREQLEDARTMTLARTADDEEMNRAMREERRWNDPMARFLSEADGGRGSGAVASGGARGSAAAKVGGGLSRPVYKGPSPPNRYGIKPGHRWDGVDRSNGFEAERFKAINRRERNKGLEYSWQMDE